MSQTTVTAVTFHPALDQYSNTEILRSAALNLAAQNRSDLLRALEDHGLQTQNLNLSPGSILYEYGTPPEGLFFIISGIVRTFVPVRGQLMEIEKIGAGQFLGLPAVISNRNSEVTAIAEEAVKVVFIRKDQIDAALRENPHLYLIINPFLSDVLSCAYRHMRTIRSNAGASSLNLRIAQGFE